MYTYPQIIVISPEQLWRVHEHSGLFSYKLMLQMERIMFEANNTLTHLFTHFIKKWAAILEVL